MKKHLTGLLPLLLALCGCQDATTLLELTILNEPQDGINQTATALTFRGRLVFTEATRPSQFLDTPDSVQVWVDVHQVNGGTDQVVAYKSFGFTLETYETYIYQYPESLADPADTIVGEYYFLLNWLEDDSDTSLSSDTSAYSLQ